MAHDLQNGDEEETWPSKAPSMQFSHTEQPALEEVTNAPYSCLSDWLNEGKNTMFKLKEDILIL